MTAIAPQAPPKNEHLPAATVLKISAGRSGFLHQLKCTAMAGYCKVPRAPGVAAKVRNVRIVDADKTGVYIEIKNTPDILFKIPDDTKIVLIDPNGTLEGKAGRDGRVNYAFTCTGDAKVFFPNGQPAMGGGGFSGNGNGGNGFGGGNGNHGGNGGGNGEPNGQAMGMAVNNASNLMSALIQKEYAPGKGIADGAEERIKGAIALFFKYVPTLAEELVVIRPGAAPKEAVGAEAVNDDPLAGGADDGFGADDGGFGETKDDLPF